MDELSSLVLETSTGRADCLNRFCEQRSLEAIDSVICVVLRVFLFFGSEDPADLPPGLVYQKGRFSVGGGGGGSGEGRGSFSKGSLKHHLFKILRRLFECCKEPDLRHRPWLNEQPKNVFACIRDLTSSISVQMYLLNGLQVRSPVRSLPKAVLREVKSVALDFVAEFGSSVVVADISLASIACSFMVKYYDVHSKARPSFVRFLIANASERPGNRWPFVKTLAKLIDLAGDSGPATGLFPARPMKEVGIKICKDFTNCLADESFHDHQVAVLAFLSRCHDDRHDNRHDPAFCAFRQAVKECFFDHPLVVQKSAHFSASLRRQLRGLFFHHFSFAPVDSAALHWISCVGFDHRLADHTDLLLCSLAEYLHGTCPAAFIAGLLPMAAGHKTSSWTCPVYDWKRIVTSPEFIDFVGRSMLLSSISGKGISDVAYFILRLFESSSLLRMCIQGGLLGCLKDPGLDRSRLVLDPVAAELVLVGLKFEQDPAIVKLALNLAVPSSLNVWGKWCKSDVQRFFDKHVALLEPESVEQLVDMFLQHVHVPDARDLLLMLLLTVGPERGIEIRNLDSSCSKLDLASIPWLAIDAADAPDCKLKKQLILGRVDMHDSLRYLLDHLASPDNQLCQRLKLQLSPRIPPAPKIGEQDEAIARSCVLEYASNLWGPPLRVCAEPKSVLLRDFLMLDLGGHGSCLSDSPRVQIDALSQLPLAVLSNHPALLAHFLHLLLKSPVNLECRPGWADSLARLASDCFK